MKNTFLKELLTNATKQLLAVYHDRDIAYQNAFHILEHVTQKKKTELLLNPSHELTSKQESLLASILKNMVEHHMPLAYALGVVPFLSLEITVFPPVLIPRSDTEWWCAHLIESIEPFVENATESNPFTVLDVCTGSGCIGLSIAHHFDTKPIRVIGIDISKEALKCATINAQKASLTTCTFIESDVYQNLPKDFTCDLIVANPPYIDEHDYRELEPEVRLWEDKQALIAGEKGYALIRRIAQHGRLLLRDTYGCGQLWCEIGAHQGKQAEAIFKEYGFDERKIIKDIAKRDRVIQSKGV